MSIRTSITKPMFGTLRARKLKGPLLSLCFLSCRLFNLLMAGALFVFLTGCNSTHIQSTRNPAGLAAAPFRNVTVVGMDERPEVRTPFENDVVALLQKQGVEATASHSQFSFDE